MTYRVLKFVLRVIYVIAVVGLGILSLATCLWLIFYFGLYIGYGNYQVHGHQEFAANGVSQIEPAAQMSRLFKDCRHFITYGPGNIPLFNSVAYFGDRYELTMQVPVDIRSKTSGRVAGEPKFYLSEVDKIHISPSGQIGASFSRGLEFEFAEWTRVYNADGDFGVIGFSLNPTPVNNFQKYADASRPNVSRKRKR